MKEFLLLTEPETLLATYFAQGGSLVDLNDEINALLTSGKSHYIVDPKLVDNLKRKTALARSPESELGVELDVGWCEKVWQQVPQETAAIRWSEGAHVISGDLEQEWWYLLLDSQWQMLTGTTRGIPQSLIDLGAVTKALLDEGLQSSPATGVRLFGRSAELNLLVDRGSASTEQIADLLAEISKLYRMVGGSGITFVPTEVKSMEVAE